MNATSTSYYKMCCVDNFISISTSPVLSNSVNVLLMINLTIANCIQVYIGDLGSEATKYELEDAFTPFGAVKNVWIAKKPPGKSVACAL